MARICSICNKKPHVGNLVSHAKNRTKRWVYPNVHKIRYAIAGEARKQVHRGAVCTKCMKAGKIEKII
jgi:large subunit ribosomal protein L28